MKKNEKLLLMITHINAMEENVSFVEKETYLRRELCDFRIRFFHRRFQSKSGTLTRILNEEKNKEIHVMFQRAVPCKKALKLIDHIIEVGKIEHLVFSTRMQ